MNKKLSPLAAGLVALALASPVWSAPGKAPARNGAVAVPSALVRPVGMQTQRTLMYRRCGLEEDCKINVYFDRRSPFARAAQSLSDQHAFLAGHVDMQAARISSGSPPTQSL